MEANFPVQEIVSVRKRDAVPSFLPAQTGVNNTINGTFVDFTFCVSSRRPRGGSKLVPFTATATTSANFAGFIGPRTGTIFAWFAADGYCFAPSRGRRLISLCTNLPPDKRIKNAVSDRLVTHLMGKSKSATRRCRWSSNHATNGFQINAGRITFNSILLKKYFGEYLLTLLRWRKIFKLQTFLLINVDRMIQCFHFFTLYTICHIFFVVNVDIK